MMNNCLVKVRDVRKVIFYVKKLLNVMVLKLFNFKRQTLYNADGLFS